MRPHGLRAVVDLLRAAAPPRRRAALGLLLGTAAAAASVALLACSGLLIDRAALRPPLETLTVLMGTVQLLALGRGPLRYAERLVTHDAAFRAVTRLRLWLYDRLEPRAPAGIDGWRSGDLLARAIGDVDAVEDLVVRGVEPLVVAGCVGVGATVLTGFLVPAAGAVLAGCLAVAVAVPPALALAERRHEGDEATLRGELSAEVVDLVRGAPDLVSLGCDGAVVDRVARADAALARLERRRAGLRGAASAVTVLATGAAVLGVLATGAAAVSGHRLDGPVLAVLPLVALGTFEHVTPLGEGVLRLAANASAARRLLALDRLPVPVVDPPVALVPAEDRPGLALRRARLRYRPDLPWVLDGADLAVPAGGVVGIVGASGAGKSTLVHVLMRFRALDAGSASLGGVRLDLLRQADVRRTVGLLDQDAHLFDTTVAANIALGRAGATPEQVAAVARDAQLEPWLATLPLGLDTPVGSRGGNLSGGQRQRVALARTLLAGTPVLLLDEPTAGLDEATAGPLLDDVMASASGKTVVLVSHRRRDMLHADLVAELAGGRVTVRSASGRPDPAVAAGGTARRAHQGGHGDDHERHGGVLGQPETGAPEQQPGMAAAAPAPDHQQVGTDRGLGRPEQDVGRVAVGEEPPDAVGPEPGLPGEPDHVGLE